VARRGAAHASPQYRLTTRKAMSMPAEIPAEVRRLRLRPNMQLVFDGHGREGRTHPIERAPVCRRAAAVEDAGLPKQHACARRRSASSPPARAPCEAEHAFVVHAARVPTRRHDQDVESRRARPRV